MRLLNVGSSNVKKSSGLKVQSKGSPLVKIRFVYFGRMKQTLKQHNRNRRAGGERENENVSTYIYVDGEKEKKKEKKVERWRTKMYGCVRYTDHNS